ncbi:UNVERIFIED_CONTAM: hypothetical protein FKN15_074145 [Acipenser sinensis]
MKEIPAVTSRKGRERNTAGIFGLGTLRGVAVPLDSAPRLRPRRRALHLFPPAPAGGAGERGPPDSEGGAALRRCVSEERQSLSTPPPGSAPAGERFAYFRPRLQVELESEDPRTVREVQVKGWKVDERMVRVFSKSLPSLSSLQSFHLWNVGLTDSLLNSLQAVLPLCLKLRMLVLDGTPLPQQSYYRLIAEDSALTHVSLRNNKIDAEGAKLIGQALSTPKSTNKNLTSLNLAYNHLSDQGADHIAQGLRLNRTLLCLSLAHNGIGDEGALKLAEVLGSFALTHEETVERRRLLLGRDSERQKSVSQTTMYFIF